MGNDLLKWEKCDDGLLQDNILSRYTVSFAVVSNVKDRLRQWILLSYRLISVLQWPDRPSCLFFKVRPRSTVINCMNYKVSNRGTAANELENIW
jgi:hypothetical protein